MSKVGGRPKGGVSGKRRMEIYEWIFNQTCENGYQPSLREMVAHFDLSINGVAGHLRKLKEIGWLSWSERPGQSRALLFLRCPDGTSFRGFEPRREYEI